MDKIKIMLVDDQKLMLDGINTILSISPDFEIVCTADSGEVAIEKVANNELDLILMDIRMPGIGGVEATRIIKETHAHITILILTTFDDDEFIIDALRYGASGYLLKDIDGVKLIESVKEAVSGNLLLTGKVAQKLAISAINLKEKKQDFSVIRKELELTEREIEVSRLLIKGMTSKEISNELFLSKGTVKNYMSSIYSKIGINDRAKAIVFFRGYFGE